MVILRCARCGQEWCARSDNPYRCGKCKTPYWDKPKTELGVIIPAVDRVARKALLLRACEEHLEELRDAWERGVISEHDAKGGTRSNRNIDCLIAIRKALNCAGRA